MTPYDIEWNEIEKIHSLVDECNYSVRSKIMIFFTIAEKFIPIHQTLGPIENIISNSIQ